MSAIDSWKKRLRVIVNPRTKVQVQTTTRLETMTVTQQWRFEQLQNQRVSDRPAREPGAGARAWYTLADAARRLATSNSRLLLAAAAGEFACYVASDGLRGHWQSKGTGSQTEGAPRRADVSHLRLPADACRDIEAYGSINVTTLKHPTAEGAGAQFSLQEALWVDAAQLLLKHPLPSLAAG